MYEATSIVNGFPGKTATHGSFGWSSVWLLRGDERVILVETGPPSYAELITVALTELGLLPSDVTDVLITHSHWDHLGNVSLFPQARRWIGSAEYSWARSQAPEVPFISQPLLGALSEPRGLLQLIEDEGELFPGVSAHRVFGHTPGHLAFAVDTDRGPMLFVGDAAKNVYELESLVIDSAMDKEVGARTISWIGEFAATTGARVVPGHDVLCELADDGWHRCVTQATELHVHERRDTPAARIIISDEEAELVVVERAPAATRRSASTDRQARAE